jgi:protein arginine kinase activator
MLCDQCGEREAVVDLTQIANDDVKEMHLCERCAAERGVETPALAPKTPLGSFLAAMGKGGVAATGVEQLRCPGCGATLQDFREAGRLGCGECYVTFSMPLRDLLRRLHGSLHHVGERYASPGSPEPAPSEGAEHLRDQLRAAVDAENFELAAELRDRLRSVEGVE